jgi:uncharacterized protein (DUF1697 family)
MTNLKESSDPSSGAPRRYVAFLRNVMIGRANLHAEILLQIFREGGALDPRSHLATGNVSFGWTERAMDPLFDSVQPAIADTMGRFEPIFVRSVDSLEASIESHPFRHSPIDDIGHRCVTFTDTVNAVLELPMISSRNDAFIFANDGPDFFSVTRLIDGRGGNPNRMLEKALSCAATTRNWNTIERIVGWHREPSLPPRRLTP